jgi:hypothetical protein
MRTRVVVLVLGLVVALTGAAAVLLTASDLPATERASPPAERPPQTIVGYTTDGSDSISERREPRYLGQARLHASQFGELKNLGAIATRATRPPLWVMRARPRTLLGIGADEGLANPLSKGEHAPSRRPGNRTVGAIRPPRRPDGCTGFSTDR